MTKVTFTQRFDHRIPGGGFKLFHPGTQTVPKDVAEAAISKGRAVKAKDESIPPAETDGEG